MPRIMRTLHATFSSRGVAEPQKHAQSVAPRRFIQWLRAAAVMPMMALLLLAPSAALAAATPASHGPLGVVYATQATSLSTDWAGYATSGDSYTSVSGSWTQPDVKCATTPTSYSAYWVGLDGYSTRTVEQIGTDSDCSEGSPTYYAWYEMYPAYPVNLEEPVAAGDAISASVTTNGSSAFTLTISDATQHWTFTTHKTSTSAQLGSAEWIAEAPSNGRQTLPLADFGTVTFTHATANDVALGSNPNLDEIELGSRFAGIEATPSSLSADGTSFRVTSNVSGSSSGSGSASPYPSGPTTPTAPTSPSSPSTGHHHHWGQWGGSWSQWLSGTGL